MRGICDARYTTGKLRDPLDPKGRLKARLNRKHDIPAHHTDLSPHELSDAHLAFSNSTSSTRTTAASWWRSATKTKNRDELCLLELLCRDIRCEGHVRTPPPSPQLLISRKVSWSRKETTSTFVQCTRCRSRHSRTPAVISGNNSIPTTFCRSISLKQRHIV